MIEPDLNLDEADWQQFVGKTITKVEYQFVIGEADHDEVAITFSDGTGVVLKSREAEHHVSWIDLEFS